VIFDNSVFPNDRTKNVLLDLTSSYKFSWLYPLGSSFKF